MRWTRVALHDEQGLARTAKACGPDLPTLGSSSQDGDVDRFGSGTSRGRRRLSSPVLRGERAI